MIFLVSIQPFLSQLATRNRILIFVNMPAIKKVVCDLDFDSATVDKKSSYILQIFIVHIESDLEAEYDTNDVESC